LATYLILKNKNNMGYYNLNFIAISIYAGSIAAVTFVYYLIVYKKNNSISNEIAANRASNIKSYKTILEILSIYSAFFIVWFSPWAEDLLFSKEIKINGTIELVKDDKTDRPFLQSAPILIKLFTENKEDSLYHYTYPVDGIINDKIKTDGRKRYKTAIWELKKEGFEVYGDPSIQKKYLSYDNNFWTIKITPSE
jgi:hypothetical protein